MKGLRLRMFVALGFLWACFFANVTICASWLELQKSVVADLAQGQNNLASILIDEASPEPITEEGTNNTSVSSNVEEEDQHCDSAFDFMHLKQMSKTRYLTAQISPSYSEIILPPPERS